MGARSRCLHGGGNEAILGSRAGTSAESGELARLRERVVSLEGKCASLESEKASLVESQEFRDALELPPPSLQGRYGVRGFQAQDARIQAQEAQITALETRLLEAAVGQRDAEAGLEAAYQRELFMDAQGDAARSQLHTLVQEIFKSGTSPPTATQEAGVGQRGVFTGAPPPLSLGPPASGGDFGTPVVPVVAPRQESKVLADVVGTLAARHSHERRVYETEVGMPQRLTPILTLIRTLGSGTPPGSGGLLRAAE